MNDAEQVARPAPRATKNAGTGGEVEQNTPFLQGNTARVAGVVLVVLAVAFVGMRAGTGTALIVLAGAALLLVILFAFRSVQAAFEPAEDLVSLAAKTTTAEAWKKTALKAIKDLEYERALGNVADEDYKKLLDAYREEAKLALRAVDDERQLRREAASAWIAEHLTTEPTTAVDEDERGEDPTPTPAEAPVSKRNDRSSTPSSSDKVASKAPKKGTEASIFDDQHRCPKCDTTNEPDAKFCKECATAMPRGES